MNVFSLRRQKSFFYLLSFSLFSFFIYLPAYPQENTSNFLTSKLKTIAYYGMSCPEFNSNNLSMINDYLTDELRKYKEFKYENRRGLSSTNNDTLLLSIAECQNADCLIKNGLTIDNVDFVLAGAVKKEAEKFKIILRLFDVKNTASSWESSDIITGDAVQIAGKLPEIMRRLFKQKQSRPSETPIATTSTGSASSSTIDVTGTTWSGIDDGRHYTYYFKTGGALSYTTQPGSFDSAIWRQSGDSIEMDFNNGYGHNQGAIIGDKMQGIGWNNIGKSWNWSLKKQEGQFAGSSEHDRNFAMNMKKSSDNSQSDTSTSSPLSNQYSTYKSSDGVTLYWYLDFMHFDSYYLYESHRKSYSRINPTSYQTTTVDTGFPVNNSIFRSSLINFKFGWRWFMFGTSIATWIAQPHRLPYLTIFPTQITIPVILNSRSSDNVKGVFLNGELSWSLPLSDSAEMGYKFTAEINYTGLLWGIFLGIGYSDYEKFNPPPQNTQGLPVQKTLSDNVLEIQAGVRFILGTYFKN